MLLLSQVVNGSEILEMLHQLPDVQHFLSSFYDCQYDKFFIYLGEKVFLFIYCNYLISSPYLTYCFLTFLQPKWNSRWNKIDDFHSHYHYYVREMRILGYSQLLESYSYRSLTLQYMANAFGVSETFIDKEVIHYIHNFFHLLSSRRGIGYITNCKLYYSKSNVYFSASCHVLLLLEGLTAK